MCIVRPNPETFAVYDGGAALARKPACARITSEAGLGSVILRRQGIGWKLTNLIYQDYTDSADTIAAKRKEIIAEDDAKSDEIMELHDKGIINTVRAMNMLKELTEDTKSKLRELEYNAE